MCVWCGYIDMLCIGTNWDQEETDSQTFGISYPTCMQAKDFKRGAKPAQYGTRKQTAVGR